MERIKDSTYFLDVAKQTYYAARPGFRIAEYTINPTQKVPWHLHSNIQDTFYVLTGQIRLFLRDPKEEVFLQPGEVYAVRARRPHLVTNSADTATTFLILQGIGETTSSRSYKIASTVCSESRCERLGAPTWY
jgi:mannose-6-phosphate isomerase-like protein (cupin superfamily)